MPKAQAQPPLVIATTNPGKIKEIKALLMDIPYKLTSLSAYAPLPESLRDIPETGTTFAENAQLKARAIGDYLNLPTLAEDSGLVVDALDGQPGVYSKRFGASDLERNNRLLALMVATPYPKRTARFICAAVIYDPHTQTFHESRGEVEGLITLKSQGTHGFGYDPVFFALELKRTFAEADQSQKNHMSHRGRAILALKTKYLSGGHI